MPRTIPEQWEIERAAEVVLAGGELGTDERRAWHLSRALQARGIQTATRTVNGFAYIRQRAVVGIEGRV